MLFKALKCGKGADKLQAVHFKFANVQVLKCLCLLCMLFNAKLSKLPQKVVVTFIIPIIKDKKGLVPDKDNFNRND